MNLNKISEKQLVDIHKMYEYDTEAEGKYIPTHSGWNRVNRIVKEVPKYSVVLEVGCNSGGLLRLIRDERLCVCFGIDVNADLVSRASQKGIIASVMDAHKLEFEGNKFDVCILSEVLEHVYDDKKVMDNVYDKLFLGGKVIITVPHPKGHCVNKRSLEEHKYHVRNYSHGDIKQLLHKCNNIEIEDIYYTYYGKGQENNPQWIFATGVKNA